MPHTYAVIWMRRDVIDEKGNRAFHFSNKVTDGANPNPPIGVQNTYMMQANQYAFGAYNLQVLVWIIIQLYRIAGNFRGRKLSRIGRIGAFRGENFRGMLELVA